MLAKDAAADCCYNCLADLILMSEEQIKAFLSKVQDDTSLQEKLTASADVDAVVSIAKETGFIISADALKKAKFNLTEEELEGLAGGQNSNCIPPSCIFGTASSCNCANTCP